MSANPNPRFAGSHSHLTTPCSLNAAIAEWLINNGLAKESYTAAQGARVGRNGRVYLDKVDGVVWVGGDVQSCIEGSVTL